MARIEVRRGRPLFLGVLHLPALPGAPLGALTLRTIIDRASTDARALMDGGADGFIVENLGDRPYATDQVEPHTVAQMTRIALALREVAPRALIGVNVLRNDANAALSVATAAEANFIRVNVHSGVSVTDQGVITGRARDTLLLKRRLQSRVALVADVDVKHAAPLAPQPLTQVARDTYLRACADALVVTGSGTGQPIDINTLAEVAAAVPQAPIWAGSGVTPKTLSRLLPHTDGVIVGTHLHEDGNLDSPLDPTRIADLRSQIPA